MKVANRMQLIFLLIAGLQINFIMQGSCLVVDSEQLLVGDQNQIDFNLNDFILKRALANQDFIQGFDVIGKKLDTFVYDVTAYLPAVRKNLLIAIDLDSKDEIEITLDKEFQERIKKHSKEFTSHFLGRLSIQELCASKDERKYLENLIEYYIESDCLLINIVDLLIEQMILNYLIKPYIIQFRNSIKLGQGIDFIHYPICEYAEKILDFDSWMSKSRVATPFDNNQRDKLWMHAEIKSYFYDYSDMKSHCFCCGNREGKSLLHYAVSNKNIEVLKYLIHLKVPLNKQTHECKNTPLLDAFRHGNLKAIELLIPALVAAGEKLNLSNRYKTPLDLLHNNYSQNISYLLISGLIATGENLDQLRILDQTILQWSIAKNRHKIINLVIDAGARTDYLNYNEKRFLRFLKFKSNLYKCFLRKNRVAPNLH